MSLYIQRCQLENTISTLNSEGFTVERSKQDLINKEWLTLYFQASQNHEVYQIPPKKIENVYIKKEKNNWFTRFTGISVR